MALPIMRIQPAIAGDETLSTLWQAYRRDAPYARDIAFEATLSAVRDVLRA